MMVTEGYLFLVVRSGAPPCNPIPGHRLSFVVPTYTSAVVSSPRSVQYLANQSVFMLESCEVGGIGYGNIKIWSIRDAQDF
jgi:hypothetical protein